MVGAMLIIKSNLSDNTRLKKLMSDVYVPGQRISRPPEAGLEIDLNLAQKKRPGKKMP